MNAAYLLTFLLAACSIPASFGSAATLRLWAAIATGLLVLIALRSGHVAVWIDTLLRGQLTAHGWYSHRRPVQVAAIVVAITIGGLALRWIVSRSGTLNIQAGWAFAAFAALLGFAVIRSSSLHWTDAVIERQLGPADLGEIVQGICLGMIACSALSLLVRRLRQRA